MLVTHSAINLIYWAAPPQKIYLFITNKNKTALNLFVRLSAGWQINTDCP
jgi:hypothetical protein